MNKAGIYRIFICIFILSVFLYRTLHEHNQLTELRFSVPRLAKEIKVIREENKRLFYQMEHFESPENLLQLAAQERYSYLKQPLLKEILHCPEGVALQVPEPGVFVNPTKSSKTTLASLTR